MQDSSAADLPCEVRYVKNGAGGKWWVSARANSTIEAGWPEYDEADLRAPGELARKSSTTRDYNALKDLISGPRFLWFTIEEDALWWCTLTGGFKIGEESDTRGHLRLTCAVPWCNTSLTGKLLAYSELPGVVAKTAGFRGTVCQPGGAVAARRMIVGERDPDVAAADTARLAYIDVVERVVKRLSPRDFEVLVDLLMARTGWARIAKLGGTREGVDVEAQNAATNEIAYVQVKSAAGQSVLDDYAIRFEAARTRYARMIFAVHSTFGSLSTTSDHVHIWDGARIAELVVDLGLMGWLRTRV